MLDDIASMRAGWDIGVEVLTAWQGAAALDARATVAATVRGDQNNGGDAKGDAR